MAAPARPTATTARSQECEILLKDHHEGYIDWAEFERNQKQLAANAYRRQDGAKSGRGGRALFVGHFDLRPLRTAFDGELHRDGPPSRPVYRCDRGERDARAAAAV